MDENDKLIADVAQWALSPLSYRDKRCTLCKAPKVVNQAILKIVQLRKAGRSKATQKATCDLLRTKFGVSVPVSSFNNHLHYHLNVRWFPLRKSYKARRRV